MDMIFTQIPQYPCYEISLEGVIRNIKTKKIKSLILSANGYYGLILYNKMKTTHTTLHRLLMLTFVPNPNNYSSVNHKNGIKTDNRIENLEWCSVRDNTRHAYETGLAKSHQGEKHGRSKLKLNQVVVIKKMISDGIKFSHIAKEFNISEPTIRDISKGISWSYPSTRKKKIA